MAEVTVRKLFQVLDERSKKKCMLQFKDYPTFEQTCKQKFGYPQDEGVVFVLEDDHDVEVDESAFECYNNDAKFRMRPITRLDVSTSEDNERTENTGNAGDNKEDTKTTDNTDGLDVSTSEDNESTENTGNAGDACKDSMNTENASDACEDNMNTENASDQTELTWSMPEVEKITTGADFIREEMEKRGKDDLKQILEEAANLPLPPLNICVTGSSGQGKSTLINTLRNVAYGDEGYAPVGITETTTKCTSYPNPQYPNIVFWDVPGVGTKAFPKEEYVSKIDFIKYDFFLICSANRFTTDDEWLANEVKKQKKRFYFLRTQVDQEMTNAKRDLHGKDEKDVLDKLKHNCVENIGLNIPVFLISCVQKTDYDFPNLMKKLLDDAPVEQQRSLTFGLVSVSVDMIERKAKNLKGEIWKTALPSAIIGGVPVPSSLATILILNTLLGYRKQFQLTTQDMKMYADMVSQPEDAYREAVGIKIDFDMIAAQGPKYIVGAIAV